jgi:hypothetical protein
MHRRISAELGQAVPTCEEGDPVVGWVSHQRSARGTSVGLSVDPQWMKAPIAPPNNPAGIANITIFVPAGVALEFDAA